MISRTLITCLTCKNPITARINIGHEVEQPVNFPCPDCGTEIRLNLLLDAPPRDLLLDAPPRVKIRWDENCEQGNTEGKVINIGAGFIVSKDMLHQDFIFPSFFAPRPTNEELEKIRNQKFKDAAIAGGLLPYAEKHWKILKSALQFHNTNQLEKMEERLKSYWGDSNESALQFHNTNQLEKMEERLKSYWGDSNETDKSLEYALFTFLMRLMEPSTETWMSPLIAVLEEARSLNRSEYDKLVSHYNLDLKQNRFESYSEIISDYFRAYGEFNQTLIYVRRQIELPKNSIATSSDFDKTKMFYGSAFEVLGSNLDIIAALNNILCGRAFDKMEKMDLKKFRTIDKAGRTNCFIKNNNLSGLVNEYDSTIRNASHHRWFKLSNNRQEITYRSGGTGAIQKMSYAEYLVKCNKITMQLISLMCLELILMNYSGSKL